MSICNRSSYLDFVWSSWDMPDQGFLNELLKHNSSDEAAA